MNKYITLFLLLFTYKFTLAQHHLQKANYFINKAAFALAENELSFAVKKGEPKDEVLRTYCEVYYLTGQYDNLLT
jgi:hypothetical protein